MTPGEKSRALARFAAAMNLGHAARRDLVERFSGPGDLPEWVTEVVDDPDPDEPDLDDEMRGRAQALVDGIDEDGPGEDDDLYRAEVGDNQLKHYWTRGKGLRKWATSAHPWTALYRHLVKHVGPERARRMASQWFRLVFGIWSGERKGDNPVGPG